MELYDTLEVNYSHDCKVRNWLAYYNPSQDKIHLRSKYRSKKGFNQTALHELSHWTRHESRLGPLGGYDNHPDCYEEVVCELAATVLADELELPRISNAEIADYIGDQLGKRRMRQKDWQLIYTEVHHVVEYLLEKEYSHDRLQEYFRSLQLVPSSTLKQLV